MENPSQSASNEAQQPPELTDEQRKVVQELVKPQIYLEWITPAYRQTEKSKGWYLVMGLIVLTFVLYGMLSGDASGWIVSITFLILAAVYYLGELKAVPALKVEVSQLGVKYGSRFYRYDQLKSFWILNEDNARYIHLLIRKGGSMNIIVPEETNIAQLREYLLLQIPEEEGREETFSEQLIRNLGL